LEVFWQKTMDKKSIPYIVLLGFLFGVSLVVSRFSVGQFGPITYIGLRLSLVSLGFLLVYSLRIGGQRWPQGRQLWRHAILMGVMGTAFPMTGIVSSLKYLSSGLASILITVNPAITVLLANFFLDDEPLTRRKASGVLLAIGGAALLIILGESGLPNVSHANPVGYFFVLGGMFFGSIMTVYTRKYMQHYHVLDVTGIRMFAGALVVIPVSVLVEGFDISLVDYRGVLGLLFAAFVGTFLGFLLSFHNIQRFGATAAVMTSYIVPIVTCIIGVLFLNEQMTWGMFGAIGCIILGVWLINSHGGKFGKQIPVH
jgi:drug/metabolite transporter (DMT)-like permease